MRTIGIIVMLAALIGGVVALEQHTAPDAQAQAPIACQPGSPLVNLCPFMTPYPTPTPDVTPTPTPVPSTNPFCPIFPWTCPSPTPTPEPPLPPPPPFNWCDTILGRLLLTCS